MKKAIKINLGGMIFHIDEDAYDKLKNYLSNISSHFSNSDEAKEIVSDIEMRIAELFQTKISSSKEVINIEDVDEVISILGSPTDIGSEAGSNSENEKVNEPIIKSSKRLYRDIDNSIFGGVCSGLAAYLNIDPVIVRIIFALTIFLWGFIIPIYIVLWIACPAARTAAQKLEMRGENITVSNLEKTVKREYETVKQNIKKNNFGERIRSFFEEVFNILSNILRVIFKVLGVVIGVFLVLLGAFLILSFSIAFIHGPIFPALHVWAGLPVISSFVSYFMNPITSTFFYIFLMLIIIIPLLALIYLGVKLLFRFKTKDKLILIIGSVLWFASIIGLVVIASGSAKKLAKQSESTQNFKITKQAGKILVIKYKDDNSAYNNLTPVFEADGYNLYNSSDKKYLLVTPTLSIRKSDNNEAEIIVKKSSRGKTFSEASENAEETVYNISQSDSIIYIDKYLKINNPNNWRVQEVDVDIRIPLGTVVFVDNKLSGIKDYFEVNYNYDGENFGKTLIMSNEGLTDIKTEPVVKEEEKK